MANIRPALALRNALADTVNTALNAGSGPATIEIYSGTIPTNADTAIGAQVLLAVLTCTDPAAPSASASVLTFSAITGDSSANATGTPCLGFIAQEVAPLFPEIVSETTRGEGDAARPVLGLKYDTFGVIAIAAVQQLKQQLEAKLAALDAQLRELAGARAR